MLIYLMQNSDTIGKSDPKPSLQAHQVGTQGNMDKIPEIEGHAVNDDHQYASEEVSAAISKQLSCMIYRVP